MAGVSTNVYELDSIVRGQHVYKSAWTPFTDKCISGSRGKTMNMINALSAINCSNIQKEDAHIKRDIENKQIFLNVWH